MRGFDVMVDAGNDRNAFARRCMDSPRRVIDEQHRAVDHDEFGPCRCHMGLGQRRGDVGGVERGCSASRRGRSGNPWTVWRDEPKLRDQALANRSHIRRRGDGLDFRYSHVTTSGTTANGHCRSRIVVSDDGPLELHEE